MHARFRTLRLDGEWFSPDARLLDFIASLPGVTVQPEYLLAG